jgi:hypothetical protein
MREIKNGRMQKRKNERGKECKRRKMRERKNAREEE